jgi:hypothetical protein
MTVLELRFVRDPRNPCWELWPASPGSRVGLLDWLLDEDPIDAGVPEDVAELIARALCRTHRVSFLDPRADDSDLEQWIPAEEGWTRVLQPSLLGRLTRRPRFPLACTGDPDRAAELFRTERFSWDQRAQLIVMSRSSGPPPELSYAQIEAILGGESIGRVQLALPPDVEAIVLPAVDGDYAQLIALEEVHRKRIVDDLASECAQAGKRWSVIDEKALFVARRTGAWKA